MSKLITDKPIPESVEIVQIDRSRHLKVDFMDAPVLVSWALDVLAEVERAYPMIYADVVRARNRG